MDVIHMALNPEEQKRLRFILRPRTKTPSAELIEREIAAIEEHLATLRAIANGEHGADTENGDTYAESSQRD